VRTGAQLVKTHRFATRLIGGYQADKHQAAKNLTGRDLSWTKPSGGVWLSTLDERGLSSWDELMGEAAGDTKQYNMSFKPDARIVVIDSLEDYRKLLDIYPYQAEFNEQAKTFANAMGPMISNGFFAINAAGESKRTIDFEKLSKKYDAVFLTQRGLYACGRGNLQQDMGNDMSLYMWDIESAFVLNPEALKIN
jgi:hypothetical protein